ncbi:MAG: glycosyltransferase family 2 protein [Parabacteroides sp.]|nr:glycosyltransferase family 2 protein [Parabacteroides sp.]
MTYPVTAAIVMYRNDTDELRTCIESILGYTAVEKIYILDNSPTQAIGLVLPRSTRIEYVFNNKNLGFGAAHNVGIRKAVAAGSRYHVVINPDISFHDDVISPMVKYMEMHPEVGMMMPCILYPDGRMQYLPKLIPSPLDLLRRKLTCFKKMHDRFVHRYELRGVSGEQPFDAPVLSGCFSLLNLAVIRETGGYDERFFMYFEDSDLSRRVHEKYKTLYYPSVSVYHRYEGGANKDSRLFRIFVCSAIKYFNKWGWLADKKRKTTNRRLLREVGIE